jgi:hypothetical protein
VDRIDELTDGLSGLHGGHFARWAVVVRSVHKKIWSERTESF